MAFKVKRTKREIISNINYIDSKEGRFYPNGHYKYPVTFYYGKLEKYPKEKLLKIEENLKK